MARNKGTQRDLIVFNIWCIHSKAYKPLICYLEYQIYLVHILTEFEMLSCCTVFNTWVIVFFPTPPQVDCHRYFK